MAISIASRPVSRPASGKSQSACFAAKSVCKRCTCVSMYVCLSLCMTVCMDVCMSVCNLDAIPSRQLWPKILGCPRTATHWHTIRPAMGWDSNNSIAFMHSPMQSFISCRPAFLSSLRSVTSIWTHTRAATNRSRNDFGDACIFLSLTGLGKKCNYCCYVLTLMWIVHLPVACSLQGYHRVIHDSLAGSNWGMAQAGNRAGKTQRDWGMAQAGNRAGKTQPCMQMGEHGLE